MGLELGFSGKGWGEMSAKQKARAGLTRGGGKQEGGYSTDYVYVRNALKFEFKKRE